jgi:uncharacterized protein (TIGR00730 family)
MNSLQSIAIYCGACSGNDPIYAQEAYALGTLLAERDIRLVYGGGNVGLMKEVADGCIDHGGFVIGVIPQMLKDHELAHPGIHKLYTTQSMQERKIMMAQLADGFIAMPGGFGTMEEMFEVLSLTQLNYQQKPVGVLNINGYYDPILEWVQNAHKSGFISQNHTKLLNFSSDRTELLSKLIHAPFFTLTDEMTKN